MNKKDINVDFEGIIEDIERNIDIDIAPAPKKKKEAVAQFPMRTSIFGRQYEDNPEHWKEYPGAGWVHTNERLSFSENYKLCSKTNQYYLHNDVYRTIVNDKVEWVCKAFVKKNKWQQCGGNGYYCDPKDGQTLLNRGEELCFFSNHYIQKHGGAVKCDYNGQTYAPGCIVSIKKSEKYKCISVVALKSSGAFTQCSSCGEYFENKDVQARPRLDNQNYCDICYMKAIRREVILKHDAANYPAPIYTDRINLGYKIVDGVVFATNKHQKTKNPRLFGVELETEMSVAGCKKDNLNRLDIAHSFREVLGDDFVITKEDGSLIMNGKYSDGSENGTNYAGFEIVSAPANIDFHRDRWYKIINVKGYKHLRSWDTDTCGCHVHVSREALTLFQIARINVFVNHPKNQEFVQKIAGRPSCEYYKYHEVKPTSVLVREERDDSTRRWSINLTNRHTVEFRIFRGTVNPRHIIRNIEFCDALCDFCHPASRSISQLGDYTQFLKFVSDYRKLYPMLAEWLALHKMIKAPIVTKKTNREKLTLKLDAVPESEIKLKEKMRVIKR